ncbi:MAG: hypothetical protein VYE27_05030 [Pseudomonadota bacterium]|nr:hypothetical protein [Pseudomonadota bacterium]
MTCRIVIFLVICYTPIYAASPQSAIEWLNITAGSTQVAAKSEKNTQEVSTSNTVIQKTELKTLNFNGIGVIPSEISGINSKIWLQIDQSLLASLIESLPTLQFYNAKSFFKRLLISETDPPKVLDPEERQEIYLLARIDRLIGMGALDEAEELIHQVRPLSKEIFRRWKKIALLGGRLTKLCKELIKTPNLSDDASLRVVCFAKLGDLDTATLVLSTAASLRIIDEKKEALLVYHLDPQFIQINEVKNLSSKFDELEFYLLDQANILETTQALGKPYLYRKLNKNSFAERIYAAEQLTISQAINGSKLFELYRSSYRDISNGPEQLALLFELDEALRKPNKIALRNQLVQAISKMYNMRLINPFAEEYALRLAELDMSAYDKKLNDMCMKLFLLDGTIPRKWQSFSTTDPYLETAFNLLKESELTLNHISNFFELIDPSLASHEGIKKRDFLIQVLASPREKERSGQFLLKALHLSSQGQGTEPDDFLRALLILKSINESQLAKSIMIEYLVNLSHQET